MTVGIKTFGRRLVLAALPLSLLLSVAVATPAAHPSTVAAYQCVRIINGVFNPKGPDDFMPYLNGEYLVIHNYCGSSADMTGWKITDLSEWGFIHTYNFPAAYRIGAYRTIYLHSGTGTDSSINLYWQRPECAVWNNTAPERAFLRTPSWTVVNSWSPYP